MSGGIRTGKGIPGRIKRAVAFVGAAETLVLNPKMSVKIKDLMYAEKRGTWVKAAG